MTNRKREKKIGTGTKKMIEKCRSVKNARVRAFNRAFPAGRTQRGREERFENEKRRKRNNKNSVLGKEKKVNGSKCSFSGRSKTKNNKSERERAERRESDGHAGAGCPSTPPSPPPCVAAEENKMFKFHLWDDLDWLRVKLNFCGEEWMLEWLD